uniref:Uncharacterized protein n=1 Tax=Chromera velia CCMP2878 TaxID=1169474 RepID=A0A0G4HAV5_9ALVE|eukprot:Cvel_6091.t1-p1 / transcript=Cvel_6091.t1 / gene=Cvel_6091 / organism=Chromera_velia_CCMP2878 / gene_product=hypothetical protein / transcript_product=hypothetical protein / location=Cvel_scaffold293:66782-67276(-) / protein_length=165 / sequence_SO=supercontig / SO=protein_coding / is_pseudo=false
MRSSHKFFAAPWALRHSLSHLPLEGLRRAVAEIGSRSGTRGGGGEVESPSLWSWKGAGERRRTPRRVARGSSQTVEDKGRRRRYCRRRGRGRPFASTGGRSIRTIKVLCRCLLMLLFFGPLESALLMSLSVSVEESVKAGLSGRSRLLVCGDEGSGGSGGRGIVL